MRIGIALFQFFRGRVGGIGEYLEQLVPRLLQVMSAEDQLVLCGNRENLSPFNDLVDVRLHREEFGWSRRWIQALRFADLLLPLSSMSSAARRMNGLNLDVLLCPQQSIFPHGVRAKTVVTVVDLLHYRCPDQVNLWQRWLRRRKEQQLVRDCDHTISISEATRSDLQLFYPIKPEKCSVVHLGGRSSQCSAGRNPVPAGAPYLFYPAAAFPHKNHDRLFAAFRRFREARPDIPARLVLSGQSSATLNRLLQEHVAASDMLHLGFVPRSEVAAAYSGCQGVIIPSLFEGFGMPVVEGLGYGRPVCCSNLPVFHELVGNAVQYFDPHSVESIAKAIEDLFLNRVAVPDPAVTETIQARLNWDRCAEQTYAILKAA